MKTPDVTMAPQATRTNTVTGPARRTAAGPAITVEPRHTVLAKVTVPPAATFVDAFHSEDTQSGKAPLSEAQRRTIQEHLRLHTVVEQATQVDRTRRGTTFELGIHGSEDRISETTTTLARARYDQLRVYVESRHLSTEELAGSSPFATASTTDGVFSKSGSLRDLPSKLEQAARQDARGNAAVQVFRVMLRMEDGSARAGFATVRTAADGTARTVSRYSATGDYFRAMFDGENQVAGPKIISVGWVAETDHMGSHLGMGSGIGY